MSFAFKPGVARRKEENKQAEAEERKSELVIALCQCAATIEQLAVRQLVLEESAKDMKQTDSADDGSGLLEQSNSIRSFHDVVVPLHALLQSDVQDVKVAAAISIGKVAQVNAKAKHEFCQAGTIAGLVYLMEAGGLEAITAMAIMTSNNSQACDQVVACPGAIDRLTSYINTYEGDQKKEDDRDSETSVVAPVQQRPRARRRSTVETEAVSTGYPVDDSVQQRPRARRKSTVETEAESTCYPMEDQEKDSNGPKSLADLRGGLLPGMTAARDVDTRGEQLTMVGGVLKRDNRPTIVPVSVKTEAVATLRNIATSSDANREAITQQGVIPQLVQLMTKMKTDDDNKSSGTANTADSAGSGSKKGKNDAKPEGVIDRKQLALDNRMLAESAGQMLHTLILEGRADVKRLIISAIISSVQQPGSIPPEDVPALMIILRSAAEEQLELVRNGDDAAALQSALEFGRWIKVPAIMLGEARNQFRTAQEKRKKDEKQAKRRIEMGLLCANGATDAEGLQESESTEAEKRADDAKQAALDMRKWRRRTRAVKRPSERAAEASRPEQSAELQAIRQKVAEYEEQIKHANADRSKQRMQERLRRMEQERKRIGGMVDAQGRFVGAIGILETPTPPRARLSTPPLWSGQMRADGQLMVRPHAATPPKSQGQAESRHVADIARREPAVSGGQVSRRGRTARAGSETRSARDTRFARMPKDSGRLAGSSTGGGKTTQGRGWSIVRSLKGMTAIHETSSQIPRDQKSMSTPTSLMLPSTPPAKMLASDLRHVSPVRSLSPRSPSPMLAMGPWQGRASDKIPSAGLRLREGAVSPELAWVTGPYNRNGVNLDLSC